MTKTNFMLKLNSKLIFELPFSELKKIATEYNGYFSEGKKHGKTDEQIISELGTPALVATEILSERGYLYKIDIRNSLIRIVAVIVLLSTILLCEKDITFNYYCEHMEELLFILYTLISPTIIVIILGGKKLLTTKIHAAKLERRLYFFNIVPFLIALLLPAWLCLDVVSYFNGIENFWYSFLLPIKQQYDIGEWIATIYAFIKLLILVMTVISSITAMKKGRAFLPLIYINSASLYGIIRYGTLLQSMDDPSTFMLSINVIIINVLLSVLIIIVSSIIIHFVLKAVSRRQRR